MTGRPFCEKRLAAKKVCETCGKQFTLEGRKSDSLKRFMKRRFCSRDCNVAARPKDFWSRLNKTPSGCWEWTLRVSAKGYGVFDCNGKTWRAHRLAYILAKGEIPDGMMILHGCDNRKCCNPDHLRTGTAKENMQDAKERGRIQGIHPKMLREKEDIVLNGTIKEAADLLGCGTTTIWRHRKQMNDALPNKRPGYL
jgi:hypothetical protein